MKKNSFLALVLLSANIAFANAMQRQESVVLEKIQGQENLKDEKAVYMSCRLNSKQLTKVKNLGDIARAAVKEKKVEAMHIVATVPSIEYKITYNSKDYVLKRDGASLSYLDGKNSKKLIEIIDKYCKWSN